MAGRPLLHDPRQRPDAPLQVASCRIGAGGEVKGFRHPPGAFQVGPRRLNVQPAHRGGVVVAESRQRNRLTQAPAAESLHPFERRAEGPEGLVHPAQRELGLPPADHFFPTRT